MSISAVCVHPVKLLAAIFFVGCSTTSGATRPLPTYSELDWPDMPEMLYAIECASARIDGDPAFAKRLVAVGVYRVDNYRFRGCYDPDPRSGDGCSPPRPAMPTPAVYLNSETNTEADIAAHTPIVYELLCRRWYHLKHGDPRKCTAKEWDEKRSALYAPAIRECRLEYRAKDGQVVEK